MVPSGVGDSVFELRTFPGVWGGTGNLESLTTTISLRLIVEPLGSDQLSASRAVWAFIVSNGTMQLPILMERDSQRRFKSRSYQTLRRDTPSDLLSGELTLQHYDEIRASVSIGITTLRHRATDSDLST